MKHGAAGSVLRHLRQLCARPETPQRSDRELLRQFVASRDETAFAALVERHGPLVLGVCRRLLGQVQDAEDAFQATFLVLARRAASIRKREAVGSWLYGVAYRVALHARRRRARQRQHEQPNQTAVAAQPDPRPEPGTEAALRELRGALDAAVQQFPRKYREPFVLCCLQGRTKQEAARELGWSAGTLPTQEARLALRRLASG